MMRPATPSPKWAARRELGLALFDLFRWIPSLLWYLMVSRKRHEAEVRSDLASEPVRLPTQPSTPDLSNLASLGRPVRIFLSCAETSGAIHSRNLAAAIFEMAATNGIPRPEIVGFGGESLAKSGVQVLADPVQDATLHAGGILQALPFYVGLIRTAAKAFQGDNQTDPIDLFVPVDSPALHVPMARVAQKFRVPTIHHIAPQFWGWAPWRVKRYRKVVMRGLTILPFEPHWYARQQVPVTHVGHPLLDELAKLPKPPAPDAASRTDWVLLPGSRRGEIADNLPWMLRAIESTCEQQPDLRWFIAQSNKDHRAAIEEHLQDFRVKRPQIQNSITLTVGDLHETLASCRGALAVSGTVLTDLLFHRIPAVVIYRDPGGWKGHVVDKLLTTGMFASTNLIAGKRVINEYCFGEQGPLEQVALDIQNLNRAGPERERCIQELERVSQRLGPAGACQRAASAILETLADQFPAKKT
jgi:lipid-A-disaccharide synthase